MWLLSHPPTPKFYIFSRVGASTQILSTSTSKSTLLSMSTSKSTSTEKMREYEQVPLRETAPSHFRTSGVDRN